MPTSRAEGSRDSHPALNVYVMRMAAPSFPIYPPRPTHSSMKTNPDSI